MSAPLSEQQLAEIRLRFARANASRALLGSTWTVSAVGPKSVLPPTSFVVEDTLTTPDVTVRASVGVFGEKPLAAFVAAARSDVPALLAEVDRLRAERDAFADRVDTLTAVAKSNKRAYAEMYAELSAAESRGRALGHVAGLREAAEMIDVDDDCDCGGCDSCTSRQDAARIRAHADLLTAAGGAS